MFHPKQRIATELKCPRTPTSMDFQVLLLAAIHSLFRKLLWKSQAAVLAMYSLSICDAQDMDHVLGGWRASADNLAMDSPPGAPTDHRHGSWRLQDVRVTGAVTEGGEEHGKSFTLYLVSVVPVAGLPWEVRRRFR